MHIKVRNVNEAFKTIISGIDSEDIPTIETPSRNGPVLQIPEPITVTYLFPRERVLFNAARDANPFLHLYEALWMLAGRNDVKALKFYASKIDQFSDDDQTFNGAYGYRWRSAKAGMVERYGMDTDTTWKEIREVDQLTEVIRHLKGNPESRRAVLQMWNVESDLLKVGSPCTYDKCRNGKITNQSGEISNCFVCKGTGKTETSRDVCCNLSVMFSLRAADIVKTVGGIRPPGYESWTEHPMNYRLDMTVTNRSNDLIWGMLGANVVHFSFLQEYIACALGIEVGHYHQFSNNAHVYTETNSGWHPKKWLEEYNSRTMHSPPMLAYDYNVATSSNLFGAEELTGEEFDKEVKEVVEFYSEPRLETQLFPVVLKSDFLRFTVVPILAAYQLYKTEDLYSAHKVLHAVAGADWRVACRNWIERRLNKKGKSDG